MHAAWLRGCIYPTCTVYTALRQPYTWLGSSIRRSVVHQHAGLCELQQLAVAVIVTAEISLGAKEAPGMQLRLPTQLTSLASLQLQHLHILQALHLSRARTLQPTCPALCPPPLRHSLCVPPPLSSSPPSMS